MCDSMRSRKELLNRIRAKSLVLGASIALSVSVLPTLASGQSAQLPLKVSSNRRYLVDQKDKPFLLHGDTAWSLITAVTEEEAERYLEDRRKKGFNTIDAVGVDR